MGRGIWKGQEGSAVSGGGGGERERERELTAVSIRYCVYGTCLYHIGPSSPIDVCMCVGARAGIACMGQTSHTGNLPSVRPYRRAGTRLVSS
jgi:hypothetical protein